MQIRPRQSVMVHLLLSGKRYAFGSSFTRAHCFVRLNARQKVAGCALAVPAEIREQQRRADFRLSLASFQRIMATVHRGSLDGGGCAPIDARPWPAWLVNISSGGVGAVVDSKFTRDWRAGEVFFLTFRLPEVEVEFLMTAQLRYCRRIRDGRATVAGFMFTPWPFAPLKPYQQTITRFIATKQRKQLRRGR